FEGLTDYDPKTLEILPGVAARWESNADKKEWTFYLRQDARWSNGEPVTARDFVRSWQRTLQLGDKAPHARLLENIVGVNRYQPTPPVPSPAATPTPAPQAATEKSAEKIVEKSADKNDVKREAKKEAGAQTVEVAFGAEAVGDYVLRVRLQQPDQNFPSLVAHPVFRPVHQAESKLTTDSAPAPEASTPTATTAPPSLNIVSNGAFQLAKAGQETVVLERAGSYWDAKTISLQRVQFVATRDAEEALAAYRSGDIDAVTNAGFEPLALKMLAPYRDFRRETYGAITYYSFNTTRAPFTDVRVREALAISIDRERISEDEMEGATEPAVKFLPARIAGQDQTKEDLYLERDVERAQSLMAAAGFPRGEGFPHVKLLINRNDQQRQVAQSVAAMWKSALGVETEVVAKDWSDYEASVRAGDYDVVRRGLVMQTMDETTNMRAMFEPEENPAGAAVNETEASGKAGTDAAGVAAKQEESMKRGVEALAPKMPEILTEAQALKELPAMPIYFASSYALVKPYVVGFDTNLLDAPSLKRVRIDTTWQAPKKTTMIWFKDGN
ncbi:MAG: peptide ABC transporter substrate-binding protein, partial [Pyrinomonadaceae bacterium]